MTQWTPDQWVMFLGALGALVTLLVASVIKIIMALQGVESKVAMMKVEVEGAVKAVGGTVDTVAQKVDTYKIQVDGRLEKLMEQIDQASFARGREEGRAELVVPIPTAPPTFIVVPTAQPIAVPAEVPTPLTVGKDHLMVEIPTPMPPVLLVPAGDKEKEKEE